MGAYVGIPTKQFLSQNQEEIDEETAEGPNMNEETAEGPNMNGHIAIDVLGSAFVDSIRQRLSETPSSLRSNQQPTIYRVPMGIRQYENEAYEPRLVSIGPYHHNKKSLKSMEEIKWRCLRAILSRNPAVSLENYYAKIKALEARARRSYSERIELDSNEFLKMMLLDGCFIVELFVKTWIGGYDIIYNNRRLWKAVCADMLLLENQLPYCILHCIFSLVFPTEDANVELVKAAIRAIGFWNSVIWLPLCRDRYEVESYHHLLHLIHCHLLPSPREPEIDLWYPTIPSAEKTIPSAEKLDELGIKFKSKSDSDSVLGVEFKNGVMEIPHLFIDTFTIRLFRNFVAFEQCYPSAGSCFTAYAFFMDTIINTKADVEVLCEKGILEHAFDRDEEVVHLFNGLAEGILGNLIVNDNYLSSQLRKFHQDFHSKWRRWRASYWETKWHRWRASLMHDYFRKPASFIAFIGAIVVIILTAIQSIFSVYAYARPPHQS